MEIRTGSHRGQSFFFACSPEIHASWWTFEDEKEIRELCWDIAPGDIVFDIGSCYGSYALSALSAGASYVWAFNPRSNENEFLKASLQANGWERKCHIFPCGLSGPGADPVDFPVRTLDALLPEFEEPSKAWVKMDVEGMEAFILRGAVGFLGNWKPNLFIECHDLDGKSTEDEVVELLQGLGYWRVSSTAYHAVRHVLLVPSATGARP